MKKIFMTMLAMLLASNLFADGKLFNVCFGSEPAIQGKLYSYYANGGILNVMQVLKNGILVKKNDMFEGSIFLQEKIIFIKMNRIRFSINITVTISSDNTFNFHFNTSLFYISINIII